MINEVRSNSLAPVSSTPNLNKHSSQFLIDSLLSQVAREDAGEYQCLAITHGGRTHANALSISVTCEYTAERGLLGWSWSGA